MAMKSSDVCKITGMPSGDIFRYLCAKRIMTKIDGRHFKFNDSNLDKKLLVHMRTHNGTATQWRHEAKEYLNSIAHDCRNYLDLKIKTTFVEPCELPFIRNKEYIIEIKVIGKNYIVFTSELGEFVTKKLVNELSIKKGHRYIMIMGDTKTIIQESDIKSIIIEEESV